MELELEEYNFIVEYLKGKDNHVADALLRKTFEEVKNINRKINKVTTRYRRSRNPAQEKKK